MLTDVINIAKEWDTAASEVILFEASCSMVNYPERKQLLYNKKELKTPFFIVCRNGVAWE